jgi:uncharacterized protein YndB with AHSA1/START domain
MFMTKALEVKNEILINGTASQVWDALTNPEKTTVYMFGCKTVSDWKVGSPLLWQMIHEGKDFVPVKGIIIAIEPNKMLKYTVIDPHASYPDIPANYLNVTYQLTEQGAKTLLTVIQDGFEGAAEGEKRYKDVYNNGDGWNPILVQIKKLVEEN